MQEIEEEIALENRSGDFHSQLSVSMGHEVFNPRLEESLELLEKADQKMYKQKRRKKQK